MTFTATRYEDARLGERQVRANSQTGPVKPRSSPYFGLDPWDMELVADTTRALLNEFPAGPGHVVEAVLDSWKGITRSRIGRAQIGVDIFPTPQVIGSFLHELIPMELHARFGTQWRGDTNASEKDLVFIPDDRFSAEIKTSSNVRRIFGNRSFGQKDTGAGKKSKDGYYIAVNFRGWERDGTQTGEAPGVGLIRMGWLDHVDWLAQTASSGQAAALPPTVENAQLLTIYSDR